MREGTSAAAVARAQAERTRGKKALRFMFMRRSFRANQNAFMGAIVKDADLRWLRLPDDLPATPHTCPAPMRDMRALEPPTGSRDIPPRDPEEFNRLGPGKIKLTDCVIAPLERTERNPGPAIA